MPPPETRHYQIKYWQGGWHPSESWWGPLLGAALLLPAVGVYLDSGTPKGIDPRLGSGQALILLLLAMAAFGIWLIATSVVRAVAWHPTSLTFDRHSCCLTITHARSFGATRRRTEVVPLSDLREIDLEQVIGGEVHGWAVRIVLDDGRRLYPEVHLIDEYLPIGTAWELAKAALEALKLFLEA